MIDLDLIKYSDLAPNLFRFSSQGSASVAQIKEEKNINAMDCDDC